MIALVHYARIKYCRAYHDRRFSFAVFPLLLRLCLSNSLSSCSLQVSPPTEVQGGFIEGIAVIRRAGAIALVGGERACGIDHRNREDPDDNPDQNNERERNIKIGTKSTGARVRGR